MWRSSCENFSQKTRLIKDNRHHNNYENYKKRSKIPFNPEVLLFSGSDLTATRISLVITPYLVEIVEVWLLKKTYEKLYRPPRDLDNLDSNRVLLTFIFRKIVILVTTMISTPWKFLGTTVETNMYHGKICFPISKYQRISREPTAEWFCDLYAISP